MIDSVRLKYKIEIPGNYFSEDWKYEANDFGEPRFYRTVKKVHFNYYSDTGMFHINGKILLLLHNTRVRNFDDIYEADRETFLDEINAAINRLFPYPIPGMDIRNFTVTHIDYCINVQTEYVKEYLEFLTQAFENTNNGSRVNFTAEKGLEGSVYIKTAAQYEKIEKRNYTLNFYSKTDWIQKQQLEGHNISRQDQIWAENILRLEVQCGDQQVNRIAEDCKIGKTFAEMFDFKVAYTTLLRIYSLVFKGNSEADYYSYQEAKKAVAGLPGLQTRARMNALKTLEEISKNHIVTLHQRNRIKDMGIYPWQFLDKKGSLDFLENPMQLILRKLDSLGVLS